ncbi:hypothetical protein JL722_9406 [Aureococcus anophagefferens]|nr:hypothetical protein JL722_9406 [Aureococcus anophagefferens]
MSLRRLLLLSAIALKAHEFAVEEGSMAWVGAMEGVVSRYATLRNALDETSVQKLRTILSRVKFDEALDSVDDMPAFELYLFKAGPRRRLGAADVRANAVDAFGPALDAISSYVNERFSACGGRCAPCASLVRRYRAEERTRHPTHFDHDAFVTVVVSLSDPADYDGGLYFETNTGARRFADLALGDAVVHQSDLFHGVDVTRGKRWSLIVWFEDSPACDADSKQWSAGADDALSLFLHSYRVSSRAERASLLKRSAALGFGRAATQLGVAHGRVEEAVRHFEVAAAASNREAHHNLGHASARGVGGRPKDDRVAIRHFLEARLPQSLNAASKAFARLGDDEAADAWHRRAAALGSEPAKRRLAAAEGEL